MKLLKLDRIFTILIVLFPIIYIYNSGISTLSIADVLLLAMFPILIIDMFNKEVKIKINMPLLILAFIIILQMLLYYILDISNTESVMTTLRIVLYYLTCSLFVENYFDLNFGIDFFKKISFLAAIFWLIQFVLLNVGGIFIQGTIPGLSTQVDTYNAIMNSHSWTSYAYSRPRSFFTEPSHFAVYVGLGLLLYCVKYEPKNKKNIIIMVLAMLLSGSGMAMTLLLIIFSIVLFKNRNKITKKKVSIALIGLAIILIAFPLYAKTNSFQTFFNRTFIQKDSTNGRFGNFINEFQKDKNISTTIFGEGIYKIEDVEGQTYITSIPRIYTYFGVVGLLIFIFITFMNFTKKRGLNLYVWIILLSISFASEILFHNLVIIYLPFIIRKESELIEK